MFKRIAGTLLLGLLAIFMQGTLLRIFLPAYLMPNLIVVLVVYLAFYEVNNLGAFLAFLLGLQFDLFSGIMIGPWAGAMVLTYALIASLSQRIFVESPLAMGGTVCFASVISNLIYFALGYVTKPGRGELNWYVASEALVTALVAPFLFRGFQKLLLTSERRGGRGSAPGTLRLT